MIATNRIRKAIVNGLAPLEAGPCEAGDARDAAQMDAVLRAIPRNCTAVFLTNAELIAIRHVIENGWGDGDFAESLGRTANSARNAGAKLGAAMHG